MLNVLTLSHLQATKSLVYKVGQLMVLEKFLLSGIPSCAYVPEYFKTILKYFYFTVLRSPYRHMAVHITTASMNTDNESNFYSYDDCVSLILSVIFWVLLASSSKTIFSVPIQSNFHCYI